MKEREVTANVKDFSWETFSPLLLQKEFVPSLQNKMKRRRKEIATRSKCIVDGFFRTALNAGSPWAPGIQIKNSITVVSHKQLNLFCVSLHHRHMNSALFRADGRSRGTWAGAGRGTSPTSCSHGASPNPLHCYSQITLEAILLLHIHLNSSEAKKKKNFKSFLMESNKVYLQVVTIIIVIIIVIIVIVIIIYITPKLTSSSLDLCQRMLI